MADKHGLGIFPLSCAEEAGVQRNQQSGEKKLSGFHGPPVKTNGTR